MNHSEFRPRLLCLSVLLAGLLVFGNTREAKGASLQVTAPEPPPMLRDAVAPTPVISPAPSSPSAYNSVTGASTVTVTPLSRDYGTVKVGQTTSNTFSVINSSTRNLDATTVTVGAPYTIISPSSGILTVPSGATRTVTVGFSPVAAGTFSKNVAFNNPNWVTSVSVTGKGALAPSALFSGSSTNGGAPLAVMFLDTSTGTITNRMWTFGDGATTGTTATIVSHTYSTPGTYSVQLSVIGPVGASTFARTNYISVDLPPPLLSASPAVLAFGNSLTGEVTTKTLSIVNRGGRPLSGTAAIELPFTVDSGSPFNLDPGATGTVTVTFAPVAFGAFSDRLVLASNGGGASIPVMGAGVAPALLQVTPAGLDFGTVATGTTAQAGFTITNAGGLALTGSLSAASGPFLLSAESYSLPAFGWTNVTVHFSPPALGLFTGEVTIAGNGGGLSYPLTGVGTSRMAVSVIRFGSASYSGAEGGKVKITVLRVGESNGTASVRYLTQNGTALAGMDYVVKTGTLTWLDGDTSPKVLRIPIRLDSLAEPKEVFKIKLASPRGAILGTPAVAKITIVPAVAKSASFLPAGSPAMDGLMDSPSPLADALDAGGLTWFTSPQAPWTAEADVTTDGKAAAASGAAAAGQVSWLQATVEGPGTLEFAWAMAGTEADAGLFLDNGKVVRRLGAGESWTREKVAVGSGPHTLEWVHAAETIPESGAVYLDKVLWAPGK